MNTDTSNPTLENVQDIQYQYASAWRRLVAFIIDCIITAGISVCMVLIFTAYGVTTNIGDDIILDIVVTLIIVVSLIYFPITTFLMRNTWGGRIMKIAILNQQGQYPSNIVLCLRSLVFSIFLFDPLSVILFLSSCIMLFNKKKRTLLDLIFGTIVVKERPII